MEESFPSANDIKSANNKIKQRWVPVSRQRIAKQKRTAAEMRKQKVPLLK